MQAGTDRELTGPWRYDGSMEIGYLGDDTEETAAEFHDYRDVEEGLLPNFIPLSFQNTATGLQLGLLGGSLGRRTGCADTACHSRAGWMGLSRQGCS